METDAYLLVVRNLRYTTQVKDVPEPTVVPC